MRVAGRGRAVCPGKGSEPPSPFNSATDAVTRGLELVGSLSSGHPNVFPCCGDLSLSEREAYISVMRRELFRKLEASPVVPCFRRLPGTCERWACELWGEFYYLRPGVLLSHPLIMTVSALSVTKQPPPPLSLLESLVKAMPIDPLSVETLSISDAARLEAEVSPDQDQEGSIQSGRTGDRGLPCLGGADAAGVGPPEGSTTEVTGSPGSLGFPEGSVGDREEPSGPESPMALPQGVGSSEGRELGSSVLETTELRQDLLAAPQETGLLADGALAPSIPEASEILAGGTAVAVKATAPSALPGGPLVLENRVVPVVLARSSDTETTSVVDNLPGDESAPSEEPPTSESANAPVSEVPGDSSKEGALRTALFGSDRILSLVGKGVSESPESEHPCRSEVPLESGSAETTESSVPEAPGLLRRGRRWSSLFRRGRGQVHWSRRR